MAVKQAQAQLNSSRAALKLMKAGFRKEDIDLARAQLAETRRGDPRSPSGSLPTPSCSRRGPASCSAACARLGAIVNAGETVFVLSLTTPVWVRSYVSEPDLGRIKPGMEVELRTDTPAVKPLKGRIGFISTTAEFTPKTVETRELRTALVYRIRIVADDPDGVLRQGMPMTVTVGDAGARRARASPSESRQHDRRWSRSTGSSKRFAATGRPRSTG